MLLQGILLLLTIIALAVTAVVAPIAWFRCIKNIFLAAKHVQPDAYDKYPSLYWNPFNSLIYYDVLSEKGKIARKHLVKNIIIFSGSISFTLILGHFSGIT